MWAASARVQYRRSEGRYASDVTDAEFALIEPLLPAPKRGGRPRTTSLREVLGAILYVLRTGCPWAMLPREFPPKSTVYGYFRRFGQEGVWHHGPRVTEFTTDDMPLAMRLVFTQLFLALQVGQKGIYS